MSNFNNYITSRFKVKKINFLSLFVFFISPILSLPILLQGVLKKSKISLFLVFSFICLLSYLYIPHIQNDKARYFEFYSAFKEFDFNYFALFIAEGRPDFILHLFIYLFAKFNLPIQFLFAIVTGLTLGNFYYLLFRLTYIRKVNSYKFLFIFFLLFLSFSIPDLFSGIRFYLGVSFGALGLYFGLYEEKYFKAYLFFFIAAFIHFSVFYLVVSFMIFKLLPNNKRFIVFLFFISLIFWVIPKEYLFKVISILAITPGYQKKIQLYLENQDFIEEGLETGSSNYIFIIMINLSWLIFAYYYIFRFLNRESLLRNFTIFYLGLTNIFFGVPNVFFRYMLFGKILFSFLVIYESLKFKSKSYLVLYSFFLISSFLISLIILRNNLFVSYFNKDILTLPTMILRKITEDDFLF